MSYVWMFRMIEFLYGTVTGTFAVNTLFLQSNSLNASVVGCVIAISSLSGAIGSVFWGIVADKFQSRYIVFWITTLGTGFFALLLPVSVKYTNHVMIIGFLLAMNRFSSSATYSVLDSVVLNAQRKIKTMNYSTMRMFQSIGYSFICVLFTPIINRFGVNAPYIITAFLCVLLLYIGRNLKPFDDKSFLETSDLTHRKRNKLEMGRLLKNYYLVIILFLNLFIQFPNQATQFIPYLLKDIEVSGSDAAIISGLRVIGEITTLFFALYLRKFLTKPMIMCLSALCFLAESLLYTVCSSFLSVVAVNLFGGVGYGLLLAGGVDLIFFFAPKGLETTALSLYGMGAPLAGVTGTFAGGILIDYFGIRALYYVCAGMMGIWLISFLFACFVGGKFLNNPIAEGFVKNRTYEI
ncbi:MAG: MFS transporter [Hespellia sp.]|nr:MFS transporter [Hespellia sp.]